MNSMINAQVGADNVAAVIIEPIQGEGGFIVPPDGFLPGLAESATRTGSSSSRTRSRAASAGPGLVACDHEGVVPDLITTAKGIAGGMPLAG